MVKKTRRGKQKPNKIIDVKASEVEEAVDVASDGVEILEVDENAQEMETADSVESVDTTDATEELAQEAETMETAPIKPVKKTSGFTLAGMLLSAILGGGIALGGAGALNQAGFLKYIPFASGLVYGGDNKQSENSAIVEGLQAKIGELNTKIETLSNADPAPVVAAVPNEITEKIAALEVALKNRQGGANNEALENSLAKISSEVASANDAAKAANDNANNALAKLSDLSQKVIAGTGGADEATIKSALASETKMIEDKISALDAKISQAATPVTDEKVTDQLTDLSTKLSALAAAQSNLGQQIGRIEKLEAQTENLAGKVEAVGQKIDAEVLAPMEEVKAAASAAIAGQKVAKLASVRALSTAIERGGAFNGELASVEALIGASAIIDELKPLASSGVQTAVQLSAGFSPIYDTIVQAQSAPAADASILSKFINNAKSIVTVRPVGAQEGSDPVSIASRIAANLDKGDLAQTKAEWHSLPDSAKELSNDWFVQLQNSLVANGLVSKLVEALTQENKG